MTRTLLLYLLLVPVVAAAEPALADRVSPVALDYRTTDRSCPTADRVADEISAKLGFVPWDPHAASAIRVRIAKDGGDLVATVEQPSGASKVLRASSCGKLDELVVSAVAVALDVRGTMVGTTIAPNQPERRLRTLDKDPDQGLVTVQLHAHDNRQLEVSRVTGTTVMQAYSGYSSASASAVSFERVCMLPCTAKLPRGTSTLIVHDLGTDASASQDAAINVNSTLDVDYVSHADARRSTWSRTKWGLLIGTVVGTVAFGYLMESSTSNMPLALHLLDPVIAFPSTGLLGGAVGYLTGPNADERTDVARIKVQPGLATAWNF